MIVPKLTILPRERTPETRVRLLKVCFLKSLESHLWNKKCLPT